LVVIGSSAGGIDALSTLVSTLPPDFPAPLVIAQHLDPSRPSALRAILARHTVLPVHTVEDRARLEAGTIYVVPANRHVSIVDATLNLQMHGDGRPVPSIDLLLQTAAEAHGENLIAVILTGMGSDGAAGAYSVKQAGGTVIIQNPQTATHPSMPRSLAPSIVDIVADLERIGPILYDLLTGAQVADRGEHAQPLDAFLERVREEHGVDFSSYKLPTIRRRLQRRLVATHTRDIAGYQEYLDRQPEEYQQLVSTFLIKVTQFFRDPELFVYLRDSVLPEIIALASRHEREIRIWSAGCATGEEAYSLAILMAELLDHDLTDWHIRIFATDLDAEAINFARQGIYAVAAVAGLPDDLIARCFTIEDGFYQVRKHIRALTVFGQHDLGQRAPFPRIDLVLCRNVLIYFTQELQKRALQLFAYALRDQGFLALGKAESPGLLAELFAVQQQQLKVYRRQGERILMPIARLNYPPSPLVQRFPAARSANAASQRHPHNEGRLANRDESYLLKLPMGVVVVDRHYDIQAINGVARRLLAVYNAAIGDDLIHLAQGISPRDLREAIDQTFRAETPTSMAPFASVEPQTDTARYLQITCYPHRDNDADRGPLDAVLLVVNDVTDRLTAQLNADAATKDAGRAIEPESLEQRLQRQERQIALLSNTNRQLLAANRELLSTNDELRTANEQFMLSVEEAQASTEEIETLNEEMQATNEELETLNEELQATVEELNTTNDELHARTIELQAVARRSEESHQQLAVILETLGDALLVLNAEGVPLLVNSAYTQAFGQPGIWFNAEDVNGSPLTRRTSPQGRLLQGESFSTEFTYIGDNGMRRWFEADGRPVHDAEERLLWAVLVIRDITDRSLHRLQERFLSLASHELRTPLTIMQGYLQLLGRRLSTDAGDERARHYTENALHQVDRLDRLITDLSDVIRLQSDNYTLARHDLALEELVARVVEEAQLLTAQTIALRVEDDALAVNGDAGRLEQILLNLVTNAIKYAPQSAQIDVRVRRLGREAEVTVHDSGPGIPPEALPHLFSRFYRTMLGDQENVSGLGLGLYIARELAHAHGGSLIAISTVGQGSTFILRLPLI